MISNQGNLTVAQGGKIILSSQQVNNAGNIIAKDGLVQLLAGQRIRVNITADGLIATELEIDNNNNANIHNSGNISATGGRVDVLAVGSNSQITHTGIIEAQSTVTRDGKIYLVAGYQGEGIAPKSGSAVIDGQLNVSAPFVGNGGFVETSAGQIKIGDHTQVTAIAPQGKTGLWLIDPQDFTIAASGGDISGATLSTNLANGNVTILSSSGANSAGAGDINVNDNVSWGVNQLTLTAAKDININAVLSVNGNIRRGIGNLVLNTVDTVLFVNGNIGGGSASLVLNTGTTNGADAGVAGGLVKFGLTQAGFSGRVDFALGGQGLLTINSANTISDLQDILALSSTNQFVGNFAIGQNLDAAITSTWNGGLGFNPLSLGNVKFDGLGHVIDGLFINRPTESQVGLFGSANGLRVSNLGLSNVNITGHDDVGALIGHSNNAVLSSYVTGQITAINGNAGGLVGMNDGGNVTDSYVMGNVTSTNSVGGLVGVNRGGRINHSYAQGSVKGNNDVGGLVGMSLDGVISGSYATSDVTASGSGAGGLVGGNTTQSIGSNLNNTIDTSYATGTVSGVARVGGLVGYNEAIISNSYATGKTVGTTDVGGLIGLNLGTINNSYWDTQGTGQVNPIGTNNNGTTSNLTGLTTAQMHQLSSFGNWGTNIDATGGTNAVWRIYDGNTAPLLRYFLKPVTVTVNAVSNNHQTLVYNGSNQTFAFQTTQSYSKPLNASLSGDLSALLLASGRNAGDYLAKLNRNALYSSQQGYDISLVDGTTANTNLLTISPAPLVISSNDVFKIYDGTRNAAGTAIAVGNTQLLGTDYLTGGNFIFDNKNVGANKTVTPSNVTVNDANGGNNYTVTYANNTTSQITPATLTVHATADNKVYDASTAATVSLTDNRFSGDVLNIGTSGAVFSDINVGNNKVVTVNGVTLSGTDAANYILALPVTTKANIERLPTDVVARKLAFPCNEFGICPVVIQPLAIKPTFDINLPPALQECEAQNLKTTPADCILKPKQKIKITTASDDDGQAATPIQSKRALIIANSNYQNVAQLAGVKKDSQAIQQELAQLGYQVTLVDDANRAEMIQVLNQMIQQSNRDDSVLIYYAGHGYVNNGSSVGYWLPTDARIDHGEQWLSTLDVARFINNIAAKQILLVSDSCFSGSLSYEAALQTKTELNKNAVLKRRSVMVLTSGSEEPVADSSSTGLSPFAASFVQSIGQVSKDSDLRGQNLYKNVFQQVTSRFKQYPTYGGLDSAGNMLGGEYIFEKK
jgi:hypothetical protein